MVAACLAAEAAQLAQPSFGHGPVVSPEDTRLPNQCTKLEVAALKEETCMHGQEQYCCNDVACSPVRILRTFRRYPAAKSVCEAAGDNLFCCQESASQKAPQKP